MTEIKISSDLTVGNRMGLHSRPAAVLVNMARRYQAELTLRHAGSDDEGADCHSILALLMLAAAQGTKLTLTASGADAEAAVAEITGYFQRNFDEE